MLKKIHQNKKICRKTDRVILVILVWVYFLQVRLWPRTLAHARLTNLSPDLG